MKKVLKIIAGIVVGVVVLVVAIVLAIPLWLGPVVKPIANSVVPKMTQTDFNLGLLSLNPYKGHFEIGDMLLGNPKGYAEKKALTLKKLTVDVDMGTLGDDCIHIKEVVVDGVFAAYETLNGTNNFSMICANAKGEGEKKVEVGKVEVEEKKVEGEKAEGKKVVVDKLTIKDIRLKYGPIELPVPTITLTEVGKKSNGITFAELGEQIMNAMIGGAGAVGGLLGDGAKLLGDGAKLLGEGASDAATAIGAGGAVEAVGKGANKTVEAVGTGAKKAADAAQEGVKKATDVLKKLF